MMFGTTAMGSLRVRRMGTDKTESASVQLAKRRPWGVLPGPYSLHPDVFTLKLNSPNMTDCVKWCAANYFSDELEGCEERCACRWQQHTAQTVGCRSVDGSSEQDLQDLAQYGDLNQPIYTNMYEEAGARSVDM